MQGAEAPAPEAYTSQGDEAERSAAGGVLMLRLFSDFASLLIFEFSMLSPE